MIKGLVDENEEPEQAAIRELRVRRHVKERRRRLGCEIRIEKRFSTLIHVQEETGYQAKHIKTLSSIMFSDPGMTNIKIQMALVEINGDDVMETSNSEMSLGSDEEFIKVLSVPLDTLLDTLQGEY